MYTKLLITSAALALAGIAQADVMNDVMDDVLTDANEIVEKANLAAYYGGADGRSEVRMIINDAQGRQQRRQFTVLRRDVENGGDQQFLVVFSQPPLVCGAAAWPRPGS